MVILDEFIDIKKVIRMAVPLRLQSFKNLWSGSYSKITEFLSFTVVIHKVFHIFRLFLIFILN